MNPISSARLTRQRIVLPGGGRASSGSAYLLTLMVLVILTMVGLSLSLIAQTEQQLGANERTMQSAFYAADSGVAIGTARAIAINDQSPITVLLDRRTLGSSFLANQVLVSPFQQILPMPCNYCEINQGFQYFNVNHAVNATAQRVAWANATPFPPDDVRINARATVGSMVEIQPWQVTLEYSVREVSDEDQKIKF
jgi:PilX N-terminal